VAHQSGVQHGWSLPVLVAFDNPTLSPVRFLFMTFHRVGACTAHLRRLLSLDAARVADVGWYAGWDDHNLIGAGVAP
jgi:hypothetical protein